PGHAAALLDLERDATKEGDLAGEIVHDGDLGLVRPAVLARALGVEDADAPAASVRAVGEKAKEAALAATGCPRHEQVRHLGRRALSGSPSRTLTDGNTVGRGGRARCGDLRRGRRRRLGLDPLWHGLHAEARDDGPGRAGVLAPLRREGPETPTERVDE